MLSTEPHVGPKPARKYGRRRAVIAVSIALAFLAGLSACARAINAPRAQFNPASTSATCTSRNLGVFAVRMATDQYGDIVRLTITNPNPNQVALRVVHIGDESQGDSVMMNGGLKPGTHAFAVSGAPPSYYLDKRGRQEATNTVRLLLGGAACLITGQLGVTK
jgi:hypothetical protein